MKKLITLVSVFLIATVSFSQVDSTKCSVSGYTSIGLSVSNSDDFLLSSYPSIEGGIMRDNLSFGIVLGRGNFVGLGRSDDSINNYYYEGKVTASFPIGIVSGNLILGYGGYFKTNHMLIEYGAGISYTSGKIGYGVLYSNWDGINYITPSLTYNF